MMVSCATLAAIAALSAKDLGVFDVDRVETSRAFAAKLGYRITERLHVTQAGKDYMVTLDGAFHTVIAGMTETHHAGERIRIAGTTSGKTIRAFRWNVRRVR